jgi:hypothetical protein
MSRRPSGSKRAISASSPRHPRRVLAVRGSGGSAICLSQGGSRVWTVVRIANRGFGAAVAARDRADRQGARGRSECTGARDRSAAHCYRVPDRGRRGPRSWLDPRSIRSADRCRRIDFQRDLDYQGQSHSKALSFVDMVRQRRAPYRSSGIPLPRDSFGSARLHASLDSIHVVGVSPGPNSVFLWGEGRAGGQVKLVCVRVQLVSEAHAPRPHGSLSL